MQIQQQSTVDNILLSFITLDTEEEKLSIYNCTLGSELGHWGGRLTCSYQTLAKHHNVMILLYGHNSRQWNMVHSSFYQFLTVFTSHSLDVFTDNKITQEQYTIIKSHHTKKSDNSLDLFNSNSRSNMQYLLCSNSPLMGFARIENKIWQHTEFE